MRGVPINARKQIVDAKNADFSGYLLLPNRAAAGYRDSRLYARETKNTTHGHVAQKLACALDFFFEEEPLPALPWRFLFSRMPRDCSWQPAIAAWSIRKSRSTRLLTHLGRSREPLHNLPSRRSWTSHSSICQTQRRGGRSRSRS